MSSSFRERGNVGYDIEEEISSDTEGGEGGNTLEGEYEAGNPA